jgi:hypothetical protein
MSQVFSNHGRKFNKPASGVFLLTPMAPTNPLRIYEVRPRKDHRGVDLVRLMPSAALEELARGEGALEAWQCLEEQHQ